MEAIEMCRSTNKNVNNNINTKNVNKRNRVNQVSLYFDICFDFF